MPRSPEIAVSTNQLNESAVAVDFFYNGDAGGSIGGAAFRTRDEREMIPQLWPQLQPDVSQRFSHVTIEPHEGFRQHPHYHRSIQEIDPNTGFITAETPQPDARGVLTYEMIQEQLLKNELFVQEVQDLYRGAPDLFISSNHFYITHRIIQEILEGANIAMDRVVSLTRFHSLPSLALRQMHMEKHGLSEDEGNRFLQEIGITDRRIQEEMTVLASGLSVYATKWERDMTARSYDGVSLPGGGNLTHSEIVSNGLIVPLSYDPESYYVDRSGSRRRNQRKEFFGDWGIPQDARFVAVVGRKDPERGYHTAVEAAMDYLIQASMTQGIPLEKLDYFGFIGGVPNKSASMVATYDKVMERLGEFAADHPHLATHIKMLPKTDHTDISHIADVEMQLPDAESWGLHSLQAMACGIPLIVSDIPTYREWAGDAPTYVNPHNHQDVVDALLALRDHEEATFKGQQASKQARRYTHERSLSSMLAQIMYKANMNSYLKRQQFDDESVLV